MLKNSALLIERYDLIRSLRKWRLGFFVLLGATILLSVNPKLINPSNINSSHIARIKLSGFIDVNQDRIERIKDLANDDRIKAVILDIDSGGGTVVGGETFYYAIKNLAAKKPVISYFGNSATSAAYMVALATNYIVSPEGAVTGSVGVLAQAAEFTELAKKLGITPIIIKSSSLKAVPHPAEVMSRDGEESIKEVVSDIYRFFLSLVIENRKGLTEEQIAEISTGRIFTGRQAKEIGLVDAVGSFTEVTKWLNQELVAKDLKIIHHDLEPKKRSSFLNYFYSLAFGEKAKSDTAILSYWNSSI
jgi:protease IV